MEYIYDYSVIVVGERHLVVYHPTDIVRKVFVEGLGVVNLDFGTRLDVLKNEDVLQLTPFCSAEQEADLMLRLSNCTSGRWHPADSSAHRFLLLKLETEISGEYEGAWSADSQAAGASAWNPVIFSCYIIEHGF